MKAHRISPSRRLGQNFLIDGKFVSQLIGAADLSSQETVLEIGPGLGAITLALAKKAKKVIAVEKDRNLAETLKNLLVQENVKNVDIIAEDILKILNGKFKEADLETLLGTRNYKVAANLPFYITAPVIRLFLENKLPPKTMVLLVQKEVGQRICAKPPKTNLLAISVNLYAEPKIVNYVSKKSFWPAPKVDSALLKLEIKNSRPNFDRNAFFKVVKTGFSHPRKKLVNNLSSGLAVDKTKVFHWLKSAKIIENARAENLDLEDWAALTKIIGPGLQ